MKIGGSNKDRLKGLEKFFQTKQEKIIPLSLEKKVAPPPLNIKGIVNGFTEPEITPVLVTTSGLY